MNWKEHAYLFSKNGIFAVRWKGEDFSIQGIESDYFKVLDSDGELWSADIERCTLIARRIEDMTEKEEEIYYGLFRSSRYKALQTPESFLYALSIGCLPEQFEHQFKTGEVIDRRLLCNSQDSF